MFKKYLFIILISFIFNSPTYSAGNSGSDGNGSAENDIKKDYRIASKKIAKAKKLESKGKKDKAEKLYKQALKYLYKSHKLYPANPDTLNYLGFANRKIGKFKDSEIYYLLGLSIDPTHNGINEYLGELYVSTDRMDLAKERLEVLKSCKCEEYEDLKGIIEGTKKSKY